jgi:arylsulfatase
LLETTTYYVVLWLGTIATWLALDFLERRPFDLYGITGQDLLGNIFLVSLVGWGMSLVLGLACALIERAGHLRTAHFLVLFAFCSVHVRFFKVRYGFELLHTPVEHRRWFGWLALILVLAFCYGLTHKLQRRLSSIQKARTAILKLSACLATAGLVGLLGGGNSTAAAVTAAASERPNVILLTFDGLSASHMASYGYETETTPRLDELAKQSWQFEDCRANANFTEGGMMALEGNFPVADGAELIDKPGLSEALRAHGYPHQAYFSHGFAQSCARPGMERHINLAGSQTWLYRGLAAAAPDRWLWWLGSLTGEEARTLWPYTQAYDSHVFWRQPRYPAQLAFSAALDYLERYPSGAYVRIHLFEPHYPYLYEPALSQEFGPNAAGYGDLLYKSYGPQSEPMAASLKGQYDRGLRMTDSAVGNFLDQLQDRGVLDQSWLILSSDHGESLSHGFLGHAFDQLPESVTRIPLLIRPPGNTRGVRIPLLCSQVDLAPTLLEALGIPAYPTLSGRSLLPWIRDPGLPSDPADTLVRCYSRDAVFSVPGEVALYWRQYRLSYRFPDALRVKLFDLTNDSAAQYNIARDNSRVVTDILVRAGLLKPKGNDGP